MAPGEDQSSYKEDGHQGVIEVCQLKTSEHTIDDGAISQVASLSDGGPWEILVEETGIKRVAEWPDQCDEKGNNQTEPELSQGNDPNEEEYDRCV